MNCISKNNEDFNENNEKENTNFDIKNSKKGISRNKKRIKKKQKSLSIIQTKQKINKTISNENKKSLTNNVKTIIPFSAFSDDIENKIQKEPQESLIDKKFNIAGRALSKSIISENIKSSKSINSSVNSDKKSMIKSNKNLNNITKQDAIRNLDEEKIQNKKVKEENKIKESNKVILIKDRKTGTLKNKAKSTRYKPNLSKKQVCKILKASKKLRKTKSKNSYKQELKSEIKELKTILGLNFIPAIGLSLVLLAGVFALCSISIMIEAILIVIGISLVISHNLISNFLLYRKIKKLKKKLQKEKKQKHQYINQDLEMVALTESD
ncbi:MAG: hypothetical protein GY830_04625 [Bacteroidetes bacterium]|nr:hypothetical protein [Bacteroidota bacterium]